MNRAVFENIEDELKEAEKMKKLKEIMAAVVAAAMVISVPVYASENDKFSDGGIAEQMEVFPAGELTGDAFDDGTEIVSEMPDVSSEPAAFAETELSSDQFVYEGVIYCKDTGRDTCRIVGYTDDVPENLILKENVSDGVNELFVYSIADKAFENCTKLKKVSVESAFFEVGKNIFDGCDGLTVECYEGTYIYKALQAKNNITLIGKERPQKVEIDNVSYWDASSSHYVAWALEGNVSIEKGIYGSPVIGLDGIDEKVETIEFPDTLKYIGDSENCIFRSSMIREIIIPDYITDIGGKYIADDCEYLEYVHTGNGYLRIGCSEFSNCPNLKTVEIGTSVESIGDGAFKNCYSLKELYIPSNVQEISATAFWGIEDSITIIGESGSYAEAYANSMGIKFRSNGKSVKMPSMVFLNEPSVSGNTICASVAGENSEVVEYKYGLYYAVEYEADEPDMWLKKDLVLTEETITRRFEDKSKTVTFPYVQGDREYYVRVCGKKKNGKYTLWSPPKKVTVKVNTPKPPEVEGITVNGSTVTVTLKNRDEYADAYNYVLGINPKKSLAYSEVYGLSPKVYQTVPSEKKYVLKDQNTTKVSFKNVKKGTYYLSVRGYAKDGKTKAYSLPSKIQKVNVFYPAAVTDVKVTGRADNSLTCSWTPVKLSPDGYIVYVQDSNTGKNVKRISVKNTSASVTIKGLEAGQSYKIVVRAYNKVNGKNYYSSYDKSQIIAFTAPKTPSLKAQAVSGHKVKLTWKPIPAAYQNGKCEYVIYYRNAKDKSYQRLTKLSDTKGSYTTKALKKNNTYYFRMRSSICDENGNHSTTGTYSNTVKVTVK